MTNSTRSPFFIACRLVATFKVLATCAVLLLFALPARAEFVDLYTGTSTYSIPIVTPPGTNGMGPNLSLQYSSGGGDSGGWVGDGWSLTGLGYIERRGPGNAAAPGYDDLSDTFVLNFNGSRKLVYTGVDPALGARVKLYRTEIDNYLKIQLNGTWSSPDYSWVVTDQDGTQYFFGQTELSRQFNGSYYAPYTHRWYLDKVMDTHGVFWRVNYSKGSGSIFPSQIVYSDVTGLCVSAPCYREVNFNLKQRTGDVSTSYATGAPIINDKLLDYIDVKLGGQLVRRYTLGHTLASMNPAKGDAAVNLLTSVTETGADGVTSMPATKFTYHLDSSPDAVAIQVMAQNQASGLVSLGGPFTPNSFPNCVYAIDLNADGFTDIVMGAQAVIAWWRNTGNSSFDARYDATYDGFSTMDGSTWLPTLCNTRTEEFTRRVNTGPRYRGLFSDITKFWHSYTVHGTATMSVHDTALVDLDGDGKPDFLHQPADGGPWYWYRNQLAENASHDFSAKKILVNAPTAGPLPGGGTTPVWLNSPYDSNDKKGVHLTDMDGDGLVDIVQIVKTSGAPTGPGPLIVVYSDAVSSWSLVWWRNLGNGIFDTVPKSAFFATHSHYPNSWTGSCSVSGSCMFIQRPSDIQLIDINGDGLPDIVNLTSAGSLTSNVIQYQLNMGSAGFGPQQVVMNSGGTPIFVPTELLGTVAGGLQDYIRFNDFNGDGFVDIFVGKAGAYRFYPGQPDGKFGAAVAVSPSPPDDLSREKYMALGDINGDGFVDILSGKPVGYPNNYFYYAIPRSGGTHQNLETVTNPLGGSEKFEYQNLHDGNTNHFVPISVTTNDGLGLTGTTSYTFSGGLFKGWPWNEFRGYSGVTWYDPESFYYAVRFHQDDAKKGLVDVSQVSYRMHSFDTTTNTYDVLPQTPGVTRVLLSSQVVESYSFALGSKTVSTAFSLYDSYGNPHQVTTSGSDIKTRVVTTDYVPNTTAYIVNRPSRTDTRIDSTTGTKISETWFDYDGLTNGQAPTKGDLTRETHWLAGGINPVTQYAYDSFGNRIGMIDAKLNTCAATGYTSKITYDSTYHTFPVSTTNALCQTTANTYWGVNNTALTAASVTGAYAYPGLLATSTDVNNVRSDSYYDVFGRSKANVFPPDSAAAPTTVFGYSMTGTAPSTSTVSKRETTGGDTLDSVSVLDGQGRVVQTKIEAATAGQYVTQDTFYNKRGLVESVNVPYLTFSSAFARSTTQPKTTTTYDGLHRPIKVIKPDDTFKTTEYNIWDVTSTDEKGNATTRSYDALNRLIKVVEPTGGGTTSYTYDYFSASTSRNYPEVIDAKGNYVSAPTIDTLGRTIEGWDPDNGSQIYTFDANGNMLTQTDSKAQKLTYTYDALNRLKTKTYPDGKVVTNFYDDATASTYRLGRMWKVTDLTGSTTFSYDPRGRQARVDKVIGTTTFTTRTSYDSLDRVDTVTYPDGEVVKNTYNSQGLLSKVHSNSYNLDYIASINYNALSQIANRTAGNGKVTTFDYYPLNFRLRNISTPGLQNITFANYDAVGNIVDITDGLKAGTQHFGYDNLNRLTSASSAAVPAFNYSYSYDAVGNMLTGRGSSYTYIANGYQEHAPISDGFCNYSYDFNGNMSQSLCGTAKRVFTWDYDNKLAKVSDATKTYGTFNYDYAGKRVKKVEGTVTTLNPFPHYRTKNGAVTKYYFANGERVAERTGGTAATNVYYYHSDHLGSSNEVSNSTGAEVKATLFYPYGEDRSYTGTKTLDFKFTGQEFDTSTGLHNYGARYYNANFMHFISPDSIVPDRSNPQSFNRYAYGNNNPVKYIDPNGHAARTVEKGLVLTVWIRDHWDEAQRIAAAWKVGKLDEAAAEGLLVKTKSEKGQAAAGIFEKNGGVRAPGKDVDHTIDKQLGGTNSPENLANLDSSVNRSFGKQIADQLKDSPYGTTVAAVMLMMSDAANAASEITLEDFKQFLIDMSPVTDIHDAFKIDDLGGGTDMVNWDSPPEAYYDFSSYNQSDYGYDDEDY